MDRIGSVDRVLVEARAPDTNFAVRDAELLNANDFQQGFAAGPRVGLMRHGDCGYDLELLYFQIDGWSSTRTVSPDDETLFFPVPGPLLDRQFRRDNGI